MSWSFFLWRETFCQRSQIVLFGLELAKFKECRYLECEGARFAIPQCACPCDYYAQKINTYLLTAWSTDLLEKLIGSQIVMKFPAFYGNRRFITAFTSARHQSLSWASSIQSIPPHPTSWRSILIASSLFYFLQWIWMHGTNAKIIILPSMPGSSKWSISLWFPNQTRTHTSPLPHTFNMPLPSHSSRFDHPKNNR